MKKMIIGLCLITATTMTFAMNTPESNVPISVREKFHKQYPDANAVHWKYQSGKWDASFHRTNGNMDMTACYDAKGHRQYSRIPVARQAMPDKVMAHLNEKYAGRYTSHYTRIDRPMKQDLYEVRVKEPGKRTYRDLYLDKRGHERDYASR